ncbi:histidine kinase [Paenibacillus sp. PsM32]|uniref:sensor histidine kinase n=1 Tax=Paenibacillus sp. PsM32 TaxID=3030536 RepID=UPI00263BA8E4|nr:histidine kinase [Paenibacillus sp. PsM32]MDN4618045.1 histidine kinase [Paenibacillus sp. PsM32]
MSIKHKSVRLKILLAMLVTTICPLILTSLIILYQISQNDREDQKIAQNRIQQDLRIQLEQYLDQLQESSYLIYSQYELVNSLHTISKSNSRQELDYETRLQIKQFYLNIYNNSNIEHILGMYVIDFKGRHYNGFFPNYYLQLESSYNQSLINHLHAPYKTPTLVFDYNSPYNQPIIHYLYPIKWMGDPFAVLTIDMQVQPFTTMVERYNTFYKGKIIISDHDQNIIYHSDHSQIGTTYHYADNDKQSKMIQTPLGSNGLILHYEFQTNPQLIFFRHLAFAIIIGSLVIMILLSILLSYSITRPIIELRKKMNEIEKGNYNARVQILAYDEIGFLSKHFNRMIDKIQNHMNYELKLQLINQQSQIKALQAQISPHFLFNTLQLISNIAAVNQVPEMRIICQSLSNMYRYNININEEWVQVKSEISHIRNYLLIINKRLPEGIGIRIHVSPEINSVWIPKLILQPVIENAVEHGLIPQLNSRKLMRLTASIDYIHSEIIIRLLDNGIGISEENLHQLSSVLEQYHTASQQTLDSIGLINIQTRIKFICGTQYGIQVYSKAGTGTMIVFRLPLKEFNPR